MKLLPKHHLISLIGSISSLALFGYNLTFRPRTSTPPSNQEKAPLFISLLQQNQITPNRLTVDQFHDHISFEFTPPNYQQTIGVRFNTQGNPYYQVQSLQNTIKIVNIKGKTIKFIDLAARHPYATLQDN